MKVEIGIRSGSCYVYKGTAKVSVDHKFTDIEKVVMDRIIVYDDGKGLGLDWGRYWQDMHNNNIDPSFVLEYIRLPQKRRTKMYTKDSIIKVKVKDVLVSSDRMCCCWYRIRIC